MRNNAWVALAIVGIIIAFALSSSNGAAGNAFTTIAVPNGTNPIATSSSDTLTLIEGSNITITGNAGSDSITIAATGAGSGDITSVGDCTTGDCFVLGGLGSELTFDPSNTVTYQEGRIYYDSDVNAFTAFNNEPDVALNIGEETWTFVRNNTGSTITNGQAVYISGAIGNIPTIALAQADADSTSNVVAIATHDIENNTTGYVTTFGAIRGLDTSAFTAGNQLYLSASTAGGVTTTRNVSPDFDVFLGTVTVSHVNQGIIYVDIRGRNSRTNCSAANQALTFNTTTDIQGCNTFTFTSGVDVEENGVGVVTGAAVLDFLSPFNVTDVAGDAQIDLPLVDDSVFVGSSSGVPTATAWPDCDLNFQATTYSTGSNAIGCQFIPTSAIVPNYTAIDVWTIPGYACDQENAALGGRQNEILYGLIIPPETTAYTAVGINISSAGSAGSIARLGLYEANESSTGYEPGALIVDAGTVAIDSTGVKSLTISETLIRGTPYFTAFVHNSAANPSVSRCNRESFITAPLTARASNPSISIVGLAVPMATNIGTGAFSDPAATPDDLESMRNGTIIKLSE